MLVRNYNLDEFTKRRKQVKALMKELRLTNREISESVEKSISSISAFLAGSNNSAEILISIDKYLSLAWGYVYDYKEGDYVYEN